jgi:hypothetical protein
MVHCLQINKIPFYSQTKTSHCLLLGKLPYLKQHISSLLSLLLFICLLRTFQFWNIFSTYVLFSPFGSIRMKVPWAQRPYLFCWVPSMYHLCSVMIHGMNKWTPILKWQHWIQSWISNELGITVCFGFEWESGTCLSSFFLLLSLKAVGTSFPLPLSHQSVQRPRLN